MNAIEIRHLTRRFGRVTAVDRLDLDVGEGEIFALLGTNGAGKTTTVRMLTGLLAPTEGDATVCGHSITADLAAVKRCVGVSPQETAVAPRLTARENLELIAGVYALPDPFAAAAEALETYGLGTVADRRAGTLSGGWQRRLSIAMALITRPSVLFLDEPTLGLDVPARRALWGIVRSLRGRTTVVLTTHYLEEAEALADRMAVMAAGRLCAVGTAAELKAQTATDDIEEAFLRLTGEGMV